MAITRRGAVLAGCCILAGSRTAVAQGSLLAGRTVSLVVPYAAGGPTDALARLLAAGLAERLGATVVTQNVPGASTTTAARQVARGRADGTVLFMGTVTTFTTAPYTFRQLGYDPLTDFTHVTLLADALHVLAANPRWASIGALLDVSRARPGAVAYAIQGIGTSGHLPMIDLAARAGVEWVPVPYNGLAPALTDTVAGRTEFVFSQLAAAKGHLDGGRLVALGVASPDRSDLLPGVPTVAEQGFPGFTAGGWFCLSAPPGVPAAVVQAVNDATHATLDTPAVRDILNNLGLVRMAPGPEAARARVASDLELHRDLIRRAGVEPS